MRDLEIRGAGNLLGRQQHGFIEEVGFDLYCRLLDEAITEAHGKAPSVSPRPPPQIEVEGDKFIPEKYIVDNQQRFEMYKRMAEVHDVAGVDDLQLEMTDRFGVPPAEVCRLLDLSRARIWAQRAGVARAIARGTHWIGLFETDAAINRDRIGRWRQDLGSRASFASGPPFRIEVRPEVGATADLDGLIKFLEVLAS
jgi:transcription-repair coupling factor (superfamily II helicase)